MTAWCGIKCSILTYLVSLALWSTCSIYLVFPFLNILLYSLNFLKCINFFIVVHNLFSDFFIGKNWPIFNPRLIDFVPVTYVQFYCTIEFVHKFCIKNVSLFVQLIFFKCGILLQILFCSNAKSLYWRVSFKSRIVTSYNPWDSTFVRFPPQTSWMIISFFNILRCIFFAQSVKIFAFV